MTEMTSPPAGGAHHRHPLGVALALASAAILAVAACTADGASPSPTPEPTAELGTPVVATPAGSGAPAATPGRTMTAWGEIWDAVPASFPLPADASPGELPGEAASGAFSTSTSVASAAETVAAGLRADGYSKVDVGTPAEDGAVTIDSVGSDPRCRVRATVRPLGGLTAIVVLYGSGCPYR